MIIDSLLNISRSQAVTASGPSTDVIDLGATQQPVGGGGPLFLVAVLRAVGGTTPTFSMALQCDDNAGFSSARTLVTSETLTSPPAGTRVFLAVPVTNERFLRANYTVGGTSPSFTVECFLTSELPTAWVAFPDAL